MLYSKAVRQYQHVNNVKRCQQMMASANQINILFPAGRAGLSTGFLFNYNLDI